MKTNLLSFPVLSIAALANVLSACASAPSDAALGTSSSPATAVTDSRSPTELAGTWGFVLAASDVAAPLRERCAKDAAGDSTKAQTCWNEVAAEAAHEKIRFATDPAGHTVWTSFGSEHDKEIVFVEVPVELAADGPGHVLAKVSGAPKGEHAARFAKANVNVMRIEVVDARTIAMDDPKKGRLVFAKE
jgi:hypothetical protein